jgi:hypothetical protein
MKSHCNKYLARFPTSFVFSAHYAESFKCVCVCVCVCVCMCVQTVPGALLHLFCLLRELF